MTEDKLWNHAAVVPQKSGSQMLHRKWMSDEDTVRN